jgi:RimJ/RimL family protein N-acetyltransferase
MAGVLDDPLLHTYVGGRPLSLKELRERYVRQARGLSEDGSERWLNWIVRDSRSGAAVGYVQATVTVASRIADVAWVIGSRFQGNAYGPEAAGAMVSWLRSEGASAVTAHIHPDNAPSQRVASAIGLVATSRIENGEVIWRDEG